jgi:thioredoxin-like negative regulator of GroEL
MFAEIKSFEQFEQLKQGSAVLAYFSNDACNVCKVLKPKLQELIEKQFPKIKLLYIKSDQLPEIAAENQVFTAPTLLVFFEGREYIRKNRNIGVSELEKEIGRLYSMLF